MCDGRTSALSGALICSHIDGSTRSYECGKNVNQRSSHIQHQRVHVGNRPCQHEECGNAIHQSSPLLIGAQADNAITMPTTQNYLIIFFHILQCSHHVLPTLQMIRLHPGLELLRQNGQELLQHQQLQDLLLGMCLWPQPLMAKFSELGQSLPGPSYFLVAETPEVQAAKLLSVGAAL
ncbi:LOW QUALITY PROTEIN: hypothetical protein MC885_003430, partial [Smutsia gigantea]